jgi:hypothetical protein
MPGVDNSGDALSNRGATATTPKAFLAPARPLLWRHYSPARTRPLAGGAMSRRMTSWSRCLEHAHERFESIQGVLERRQESDSISVVSRR